MDLIQAWASLAPGESFSFPENGVGPLVRGARYAYLIAPLVSGITVTIYRSVGSQTAPTSVSGDWLSFYLQFPFPLEDGAYIEVTNNTLATAAVIIAYRPIRNLP